jgi:hypothetical protein
VLRPQAALQREEPQWEAAEAMEPTWRALLPSVRVSAATTSVARAQEEVAPWMRAVAQRVPVAVERRDWHGAEPRVGPPAVT